MKKIKKFLLLLIAFSFTLLMFNSQAYAVEYYEFTFTVTDATNQIDVLFTPVDFFDNLRDFVIEYGTYDNLNDNYILNDVSFMSEQGVLIYTPLGDYISYSGSSLYDFDYNFIPQELASSGITFTEQEYTIITNVPITFTQTFWDNIIDAIDEAATALSSAASAGFGLIYDGVGLTALGSALVIPIGLGLVLGVFYLIIRMLPSVRL